MHTRSRKHIGGQHEVRGLKTPDLKSREILDFITASGKPFFVNNYMSVSVSASV